MGVASGAGKQHAGFLINTGAHWGAGLPCALLLGFRAGLGVEGLLGGIIVGPAIQARRGGGWEGVAPAC